MTGAGIPLFRKYPPFLNRRHPHAEIKFLSSPRNGATHDE
jgi:hypothetical protein